MGGTALALSLLAVTVAYGLVLGGVAELVVRTRSKPSPTRWRAVMERAALVVFFHGTLLFHAMVEWPSPFAPTWYARGGISRTAQIFATDVLGPHGVVLFAVVTLAAYVGPRRIAALARDACRWVRARATGPARGAAMVGALVALASLVAERPARSGSSDDAPNVVVIVVDGLRADAVDARVAPNIARLAARGTHFTRAHASITATQPAWVTLLTGLDPHDHEARLDSTDVHAPDALPARFASGGYDTLLLGDPAALRAVDDVGVGFEAAAEPSLAASSWVDAAVASPFLAPLVHTDLAAALVPELRSRTRAHEVADRDGARLAHARTKPLFAAVALSGASSPFVARAPYYRRFTDAAYRGRFKYDAASLRVEENVDAADARQLRGLYEGAVASVDAAVGRVLRSLEGGARPTIVALVGSRGERLGVHRFGVATTHVPFVLVDPRQPGRGRIDSVVRDVDLAPTLAELAGLDPTPMIDGRSLVPALRGEPMTPMPAMAESVTLEDLDSSLTHRQRMIRDDRFELVYTPALREPEYALYDLVTDPGESHDVSASHPLETAGLRRSLWSWMIRDPSMEKHAGLLVPRTVARPRRHPAYEVATRLTDRVSKKRTSRITLGNEARTALDATDLDLTLDVPREAKLAFAEGTASGGATFVVAAREGGTWRELYRHRSAAQNAWSEASVDLSEYAGSSVELRLVIEPSGRPTRAYWGSPVLLRKGVAPRSILWIAVDGMRADRAALPHIAGLARDGVWLANAHASGLTRSSGTVALLAGARPSEVVGDHDEAAHFAPVTLARSRLQTREFVERPEETVPSERALDGAFESVIDSDGDVTAAARTWIAEHAAESFCAFVHYRSEADPKRVDASIGALAQAITDAGLRDDTVIILSGTTPAFGDPADLANVPLVIVAPGILPSLDDVAAPVRTIDVAPTLFELLGLEPHPRTSGLSFRKLAVGAIGVPGVPGVPGVTEEPRTLLAEAPGLRTLDHESYRLVQRHGARLQLLDTRSAPARDVTATEPDMVAEMNARLEAALADVPVASSRGPAAERPTALLRLRFAGGGSARRIMGTMTLGNGDTPARSYRLRPVEVAADAVRDDHGKIDLAFRTDPGALVGFDIELDPPTVPVHWQWWIDDAPWAASDVFAGFWLLPAAGLVSGIDSDEGRALAGGTGPLLGRGLAREVGMFVTRHAH